MTGIPVGTFISFDATEYAVQGGGTSYVAFQLDQLYTNIGTIFYSQRYSGGDQESQVSLWGRASGAFAASDPGTSPDTVIPLTPLHGSGAYWDEYYMTNVISGRYFLLRFDQNTPGGNPGGREFRLGLLFPPTAHRVFRHPFRPGVDLGQRNLGTGRQRFRAMDHRHRRDQRQSHPHHRRHPVLPSPLLTRSS